MGFYKLSKNERSQLVEKNHNHIRTDLTEKTKQHIQTLFSDEDTYIRKSVYLSIGKIYKNNQDLRQNILYTLSELLSSENEKIRQTSINASGEIGIRDFEPIEKMMEKGLFDGHHIVRNAVIGSIKKMGEKNPRPVLAFAKRFLHHPDKEIRREICHGIELRGRTHPQDILPLLKELEHDKTARVRNTVVHVLGQIAYKKGCLETVVSDLKNWENKTLVADALEEIIDVHNRYKDFAVKTQEEARDYILKNF
ncbi:MAG TPA: HEAT repeat domain-containing protein [Cytophagales bacterium]|nr:HEAT repeat domain-containing protein [Cytophagales bacterium]